MLQEDARFAQAPDTNAGRGHLRIQRARGECKSCHANHSLRRARRMQVLSCECHLTRGLKTRPKGHPQRQATAYRPYRRPVGPLVQGGFTVESPPNLWQILETLTAPTVRSTVGFCPTLMQERAASLCQSSSIKWCLRTRPPAGSVIVLAMYLDTRLGVGDRPMWRSLSCT